MTRLRLVLMGAGMIGREHAALILDNSAAELVAIADPAPEANTFASQIGTRHYDDYERMLDEMKPDGAIVALPNHLHVPAAIACIDRGFAVLVEKPVADTLDAARRLTIASEASGVPVLVGHHRRHSPDIRESRRIVRGGELGDLVTINGMCLFDKPDDYFNVSWRRSAGGGPLLINLIHDIDCLRYICGEIDSVRAFVSNSARGFEVEDTASVSLRFANGVLGSFIISDAVASPWSWELTSGQARYFPHQPGAYLFFGGRKASLSVSDMYLWRHAAPDGHWQHPFVRDHRPLDGSRAYSVQLDHFLGVITRDVEPLISARDGMMTLAATLAIAQAAREDRTVSVAEFAALPQAPTKASTD